LLYTVLCGIINMIEKVFYENPITGETRVRTIGMKIHDEFTNEKYSVSDIKIDVDNRFIDILYSNDKTERTYKILNVVFSNAR